jgi:hypothetical protein
MRFGADRLRLEWRAPLRELDGRRIPIRNDRDLVGREIEGQGVGHREIPSGTEKEKASRGELEEPPGVCSVSPIGSESRLAGGEGILVGRRLRPRYHGNGSVGLRWYADARSAGPNDRPRSAPSDAG